MAAKIETLLTATKLSVIKDKIAYILTLELAKQLELAEAAEDTTYTRQLESFYNSDGDLNIFVVTIHNSSPAIESRVDTSTSPV